MIDHSWTLFFTALESLTKEFWYDREVVNVISYGNTLWYVSEDLSSNERVIFKAIKNNIHEDLKNDETFLLNFLEVNCHTFNIFRPNFCNNALYWRITRKQSNKVHLTSKIQLYHGNLLKHIWDDNPRQYRNGKYYSLAWWRFAICVRLTEKTLWINSTIFGIMQSRRMLLYHQG